jgi:hypothetical protein
MAQMRVIYGEGNGGKASGKSGFVLYRSGIFHVFRPQEGEAEQ